MKTQLGYYKNLFLRKAFEEGLQPEGRKSLEAHPPGSCTNRAVQPWMEQQQVPPHGCRMSCKQHFPPGNSPISALPGRKHCLARTNRIAATAGTGGELCCLVVTPTTHPPGEWMGKESPVLSQQKLRCTHAVSPEESYKKISTPAAEISCDVHPEMGQFPSSTHRVSPLPVPKLCVHSAVWQE